MQRSSKLAALAALALLAACASGPTRYGPALKPGAVGFTETPIETNRYRVTFRAGQGGAALANDFALLRAAELTLQRGYDWFVVDNRATQTEAGRSGPTVNLGTAIGSWGGNTGVSIGTGIGIPLGGGKGGAAVSTLEIRMGKGPKPADISAYDARDVQQSLRLRAG